MSSFDELALEYEEHTKNTDYSTTKPNYSKIPDAHYTVLVDKVHWKTASTGTPYLGWHLRIIEGDHQGRFLFKDNHLKAGNKVGFEILAKDLAIVLGDHSYKINDPGLLTALLDKELLIKKQTRTDNEPGQDRYRVFINGCTDNVPKSDSEEAQNSPALTVEPPAAIFADGDIPF